MTHCDYVLDYFLAGCSDFLESFCCHHVLISELYVFSCLYAKYKARTSR